MKINEVVDNPQFVLVIGGAGSGKNYYIAHNPALRSYRLVDVDAIKGSMDLNAAIRSINPMLEATFKEGVNVAHPTTGANLVGQQNKIALARQYGYEVVVILKNTDTVLAVANVASRVVTGGHNVDYSAIVSSNEKARTNFEQLKPIADFTFVV